MTERALFGVVLCLLLAEPLLMASPLFAANVIEPMIPSPFPLTKTRQEKIEKAWTLWEQILRDESAISRTDVDTKSAAEDLARFKPELKLKETVGLEVDPTRKRLKALQIWSKKNVKNDNDGHVVVANMILNSIKVFLQQRRKLMKKRDVYKGLQQGVQRGEMAASWFRYAFVFAKDRERYAPLLTREFLNRLLFRPSEAHKPARSLYNLLYTLNKVYYHCDLKYSKDDRKAFRSTVEKYGSNVKECKDGRRLLAPPPGQRGMKLYWKLQDGAWRLDEAM